MRASVFLMAVALLAESGNLPEARRLYYAGIDGDPQAARRSVELLERLSRENGSDPLVMAYLGSSRLMESGRTFALWKKNRLAKEGLAALDRAIELAPDNLETRFVRAMSTLHLPGFFKREEQCRSDFAFLAPRVESAAASGVLDRRLAAATLYHYGLFLERDKRRDAARSAWSAAARIGPETRAGMDAAKRLN